MYRAGVSSARTTSRLRFDGESNYELEQYGAVATFARSFGERATLQLALGGVLGGEMTGEGLAYDVYPGGLGALAFAYRFLGAPEHDVFVTTTAAYGMSFASTRERGAGSETAPLHAADARLGVLLGVTLWETWSPYLAARGFAGPVQWEQGGRDRTGSDRNKYAVGAGSTVSLNESLAFTLDLSLFGERTLAAGLSLGL